MQNIKKKKTTRRITSIVKLFKIPKFHITILPVPSCTGQPRTAQSKIRYQVSPIEQQKLHTRLTRGNQLCSFYPQNDTPTLLFWTLNLQLLNENYGERKKRKFRLQLQNTVNSLQDEQKRTNKATTTKQGWFYISISHLQQNLPWLAHFSKSSQEKFSPWVFLGDQTYFHSHI